MKTLKVVLFALAISAGSLLHAAPKDLLETSEVAFNKEIQQLLKNVEITVEKDVVAYLIVRFNCKNEMEVLYVGSKNVEAGKKIKKCLNNKEIKTVLDPSIKTYKLPVRLKA